MKLVVRTCGSDEVHERRRLVKLGRPVYHGIHRPIFVQHYNQPTATLLREEVQRRRGVVSAPLLCIEFRELDSRDQPGHYQT